MKTLIFSIYISRHGVYQWEVKMFLNSLLTWSLGWAALKCCVAGVEIADRGILRATQSRLHLSWPTARGRSSITITPGSLTTSCLGIASIPNTTPNCTASSLFSMPPLFSFHNWALPTPEGKLHAHSPLSQSTEGEQKLLLTMHLKLLSKELFNLIYLAYKK